MDTMKTHLQMKDREQTLLTKQIRALHEDNERIVTMYKMVQSTPKKGNEDSAPTLNSEMAETKKQHAAPKGWVTVSDDFGTPSLKGKHYESKETIKRD